ncbi:MAG: SbcC/MukB-like Walker B domain-containing protein, partial [Bacillota bacterium]|nr:SbcC/MukB-like Walker B domain-containing protein [Bacillota bacterium]
DDNGFVAKEEAEKAALPRETLQSYKSSIEEYDKAKTGIEAKIEAAEKKTSRKVKAEEYEQAKCSREQAVKLLQESIKKLAMLESDLKKTEKDNEKLQKTLREQKKAEQELSYLEELLKAIRGKAFVEFAAGRMMDLIVREASHHLQKLAYGRYEFLYNYSTGFFVRDNFNGGMERSAATLSGGETFLVSLTLALALASHISRQSHPFEFFFLDEGFGTLDAGLLETVMDTLETLRSENLTVGLITHNEEIQRRIFNKLIVEQPDPVRGSTLRLEKA